MEADNDHEDCPDEMPLVTSFSMKFTPPLAGHWIEDIGECHTHGRWINTEDPIDTEYHAEVTTNFSDGTQCKESDTFNYPS